MILKEAFKLTDKLKSLEELRRIKEQTQKDMRVRQETGTKIIIGMATCGIAAGARETLKAVLNELEKKHIEANVSTVGCIGLCAEEPLVDIQQGDTRVTYGKITADKVPLLIEEHLIKGNILKDWVVAKVAQSEGLTEI